MGTELVKDMFTWVNSSDPYEQQPVVNRLGFDFGPISDTEMIKPELANFSDPYVIVEKRRYKAGTMSQVLPLWKDVVSATGNERGTLMYGVYSHTTDNDTLFVTAAFRDELAWKETHLKGEALMKVHETGKDVSLAMDRKILKLSAGFMSKQPSKE